MLSKADFEQKQILFIQAENDSTADFKFNNDNIVFYKDGQIANRLSLHKIFCIFIVGSFTITSNLIEKCQKFGISLFLLRGNLETYAEFSPFAAGNQFPRYRQYKMSLVEELDIAILIVENKITNQLRLAKVVDSDFDYKNNKIKAKKVIAMVTDHYNLNGVEGNFAKLYFQQIFAKYNWKSRVPRAKTDINNLLLDIGYTYLFNMTDSLLRLFGFDTYKGVLHKNFYMRRSLACDIMEPFRPMIDHALIKAYNLGRINAADFVLENGNYTLPWKNSRKYSYIFLDTLMEHKTEIFEYTKGYYKHICRPDDNSMPSFQFKPR